MKNINMYDHLSPEEAVRQAWSNPGVAVWTHRAAQKALHTDMPLLARALDRLVDTRQKS